MTEKTRTIVTIESHEHTTVRRSQRSSTGELESFPPEIVVSEENRAPRRWWKTVALKSARVLAPWSQRLKARARNIK